MSFLDKISNLPPERKRALHLWLTVRGPQEPEAQRIAGQFEDGKLTPEEVWEELVRAYGD